MDSSVKVARLLGLGMILLVWLVVLFLLLGNGLKLIGAL